MTHAVDTGRRMDRIYRYQRHIYDLTRKHFLLGRDRLLAALELPDGAAVCEVGCGTARNLIRLARQRPDLALYGIDASEAMLQTARQELARRNLAGRVRLSRGVAEGFDAAQAFGREPFDAVFLSYALSMMPQWRQAVERAILNLKPGGLLAIVDFCDQRDLPRWFHRVLATWLAWFEVRPDPALARFLEMLAASDGGELRVQPLYRRYAVLLLYRPPPRSSRL